MPTFPSRAGNVSRKKTPTNRTRIEEVRESAGTRPERDTSDEREGGWTVTRNSE